MTAKDLLIKYLDYYCYWTRKDLLTATPSVIRKQQIDALQEAFGLSKSYVNPLIQIKYSILGKKPELNRSKYLNKLSNLEYLKQGEFLRDRPYEKNKIVAEKALKTITELYKYAPNDRLEQPVDIGWMFNSLLNFRHDIYKVTYPNEGMLEGFSVGLIYSQYLQSNLKKIIQENLNEIDNTLWMILDPDQQEISLEDLKTKFAYNDADLESVDLEWRMENY